MLRAFATDRLVLAHSADAARSSWAKLGGETRALGMWKYEGYFSVLFQRLSPDISARQTLREFVAAALNTNRSEKPPRLIADSLVVDRFSRKQDLTRQWAAQYVEANVQLRGPSQRRVGVAAPAEEAIVGDGTGIPVAH